jgi:hypothetical protein
VGNTYLGSRPGHDYDAAIRAVFALGIYLGQFLHVEMRRNRVYSRVGEHRSVLYLNSLQFGRHNHTAYSQTRIGG